MRPTVATVVTGRPWEAAFVHEATTGARLRVIARIDEPWELARLAACLDVALIGAETPWLERWMFDTLHRLGCGTIGLHAEGDEVGARLVAESTRCLVDSAPPRVLVECALFVAQSGIAASSTDRSTSDPHTQRYRRDPGSTRR